MKYDSYPRRRKLDLPLMPLYLCAKPYNSGKFSYKGRSPPQNDAKI